MKKFQFRLQVVLDRARQHEQEQQLLLAELMYAREELRQRICRITQERQQILTDLEQEHALDPRKLHEIYLYLETLANRITELQVELAAMDTRIDSQRQQLMEAMQKRKLLEQMHDKQFQEYRAEAEKVEQNNMEETALPRHYRARMEELDRWREAAPAVGWGAEHG